MQLIKSFSALKAIMNSFSNIGWSSQSLFSSVSMSSVPHLWRMTDIRVTYLAVSLVHHLPVPDFNISFYTLYVLWGDLYEMPEESTITLLMVKTKQYNHIIILKKWFTQYPFLSFVSFPFLLNGLSLTKYLVLVTFWYRLFYLSFLISL